MALAAARSDYVIPQRSGWCQQLGGCERPDAISGPRHKHDDDIIQQIQDRRVHSLPRLPLARGNPVYCTADTITGMALDAGSSIWQYGTVRTRTHSGVTVTCCHAFRIPSTSGFFPRLALSAITAQHLAHFWLLLFRLLGP